MVRRAEVLLPAAHVALFGVYVVVPHVAAAAGPVLAKGKRQQKKQVDVAQKQTGQRTATGRTSMGFKTRTTDSRHARTGETATAQSTTRMASSHFFYTSTPITAVHLSSRTTCDADRE